MSRFQTPTGMHDLLPDDFIWHDFVFKTLSRIADAYGFRRIDTPILEQEDLFSRGVGMTTDIVEKEMYTLRTRGRDRLALRPEGTAPIVRAYMQHGMKSWPQPVRLWYWGPMFRHERPQAGRFRQFWQAGFEVLGEEDAVADAEIILATLALLQESGLKRLSLQVNSIGCSQCRPVYRKALVGYLRPRASELCPNCRKRLKTNPMRVLDCKEEKCQRVIQDAPEILDYLCEACRVHLRAFLEYLEELQIPYFLNARLVRGLDYYYRTVFEIWPESDDQMERQKKDETAGEETTGPEGVRPRPGGSQSAIVGGGRYDPLFRLLGGKNVGAVGCSIGADRFIGALKEAGVHAPEPEKPQLFLVQLGDQAKKKAPALFEELRRAKFRVRASFSRDSIKSQLRIADKLGAPYVIILGQREVSDNTVILRSMATGSQENVRRDALIQKLREKLKKV